MWDAPFSLDLTNTDPDIVYCVDIYNHSCENRHHLISDCGIEEPFYPYNSHQGIDLLEYIVTPRSNVEGARNGSRSSLKGEYQDIYLVNYILHCHNCAEEYFTFNASNLVPIISKNGILQNEVLLSLKYFGALIHVRLQ